MLAALGLAIAALAVALKKNEGYDDSDDCAKSCDSAHEKCTQACLGGFLVPDMKGCTKSCAYNHYSCVKNCGK